MNKRFKVGKACFHCRAKKIKCDGLQPCMQCKARERPCSFSMDGDQPIKQVPMMALSRQTTEILDRLYKLEGKWEIDTSQFTLPITIEDHDINTYNLLPSKSTQLQHIQSYYDYRYDTFPIFPKRLFLEQFHLDKISPLLILAMMSLGAEKQVADVYFTYANSLLFQGTSNPQKIIACMLMSLYESDENKNPIMYATMAVQMCFDVYRDNCDISEQRKRICWGCYVLDKLFRIHTKQPWLMKYKYMDGMDMPLFQPGDDVKEHAILEGFVATIKLLQIAEVLLRPYTRRDDYTLTRWYKSLPGHLTLPSSAMACQIQLLYHVIELHLATDEKQTTTVVSNITRVISVLTDHHTWIFNQQFLVDTLLETILRMKPAKHLFQQAILYLKNISCAAKTTRIISIVSQFTQTLEKSILVKYTEEHYGKPPSITMSSTMFVPTLPYGHHITDDQALFSMATPPSTDLVLDSLVAAQTATDDDLLYSLLNEPPRIQKNPFMGLNIYASAHQHHNDVIKQHYRNQ